MIKKQLAARLARLTNGVYGRSRGSGWARHALNLTIVSVTRELWNRGDRHGLAGGDIVPSRL